MADDYASDTSTQGRLVPVIGSAASTTGNLEALNDSDWFAVGLTSGLLYRFDLAGASNFTNAANLDVTLVNSSGTVLAGTGTADKTITYLSTSTATDYLVVTSRLGNGLGMYTLSSGPLDDYAGDASTTGQLTVGNGGATGVLERPTDTDWFATTLFAGLNYQFNVADAADFSGGRGFTLRDANGVRISGGGQTSLLTITPTVNGTYYLDIGYVSPYPPGTGTYTVTTSALDDYTNNASTTGLLAIGASASGVLEGQNDTDWLAVTLSAGQKYQFNASVSVNFTTPTALSFRLANVGGTTLAGGGSISTPVTFTPTASGTYYLSVSAGTATGSYELSSTTIGGSTSGGGSSGGGSSGGSGTSVVPVYRFFDSNTGTQFLTSSTTERDTVLSTRPDLISEGVGLNAALSSDPNASGVYRFFDTIYGTHFFTSSSNERDTILATRSDLTYEGIGFYEYSTQQPNSSPVYRFFDSNKGTHFFTPNAGERATILATRPDLVPEGISFYSPT